MASSKKVKMLLRTIARPLIKFSSLLAVLLVTGCALAELSEFAEVGAGELGASSVAEVAGGSSLASEAAALARAADAGFAFRSVATGTLELVAEDGLAPGALRGELGSLATRSGIVLAAEDGAVSLSGSRLIIADEGTIALRSASGRTAVVGRLDRGILNEIRSDGTMRPVGRLKATPRLRESVVLSSPDTRAVVRARLTSGTHVDVLSVKNGWYELRLASHEMGWVPAHEMLLVVALSSLASGTNPGSGSTATVHNLDRLVAKARAAGDARRALERHKRSSSRKTDPQVSELRQRIDSFLRGKQ